MLRVLAESFVVSPPSGVRIKTRLRPTPAQEQVGGLVAGVVVPFRSGNPSEPGEAAKAEFRKVRKQDLTASSSSRWAGSITRAIQDQYDLAVRALAPERDMLGTATAKLSEPIAPRSPDGQARPPGTAASRSGTLRPAG
jgi:hypothetical protein